MWGEAGELSIRGEAGVKGKKGEEGVLGAKLRVEDSATGGLARGVPVGNGGCQLWGDWCAMRPPDVGSGQATGAALCAAKGIPSTERNAGGSRSPTSPATTSSSPAALDVSRPSVPPGQPSGPISNLFAQLGPA
mmetsp:Transcript_10938/g.36275  ORF Transcript_10938/g.36275 Transcript_10938/m.36275 type:complete len:134 (+) Transcript_10938:242-643(+)|eukprot:scaffold8444_cov102-Isochrysis_galbana.AAC.2